MGLIALYLHHRRIVSGAYTLIWISLSVCLLAIFEGISLIGSSEQMAAFWFNMKYIPLAVIPVLWLIFTLQYSGKQNLITKYLTAALFVIPIITQVLIWTNNIQRLPLCSVISRTRL